MPKRRFKTSSRPWVTGDIKKAEAKWRIPETEWTGLEKKLMLAEMTRVGVIIMMNTHLFRWDGRIFLQRKGGPIGLRATCAVARVTMLHWDVQLQILLKRNNIHLDEGGRYMDDIRLFLDAVQEGWRWDMDGLYYCEEWRMEDELSGDSHTKRTAKVVGGMMNSLSEFLTLKT